MRAAQDHHNHHHHHRYPTYTQTGMNQPRLFLVREAAPEYPPEYLTGPETTEACPDPDDQLFELGERCATAYMQADALQYRAMVLLAEFHQRQGWKNTHCSSTDEWLAWRLGIHRHTGQERLRTALALEHLIANRFYKT